MKKLAERTTKATNEITEKINTIQTEADNSISVMQKGKSLANEAVSTATQAGEALKKIVESSDTVMDMVQRIAAATEEQSSASEEVSRNMEHISGIINESFGLSEEVKKSAVELSSHAQAVKKQTMYFKTGDNGTPVDESHNIKTGDTI